MSWSVNSIPDQTGKTVLVTGSNSGIGFEAAKIFASKGAEVVLACRNQQKGEEALDQIQSSVSNANVTLMPLDLADLDSVKQFAHNFNAEFEKLDILVNNAGVMAPPLGRTRQGFEMQFGTNHLGHFALTGLLLEKLESTPDSRIVTVSSVAHRIGKINFADLQSEKNYSRWLAYGQSKLANLMFSIELNKRLQQSGSSVLSVAVHPGYSATNLQQHTFGGNLMNAIVAQPQDAGAWPTLYAATEAGVKGGEYYGPSKLFESRGLPKKAYVRSAAKDAAVARKLWDISEQLTGVSFLSADAASQAA